MRWLGVLVFVLTCLAQDHAQWPQFRGPAASGVSEGAETPIEWNVEQSEGVLWKRPVPGLGHSSPVIWGDRIFLTTAIDTEKESSLKVGLYGSVMPVTDDAKQIWKVLCYEKDSGRLLWEQAAHRGEPRSPRHPKASHANSTPATDGRHVIAFFGSEGLFCYDMDGELLWKKDLGLLDAGFFRAAEAQWGYAASPVIHEGKVIVQCDVLREQFLAAFDIADGGEIWRTKRDDYPTWSTPAVYTGGTREQVIVNGFKHIGGYDLDTGKELWRMRGGGDIPVPTPVFGHGLIFISNSHGGASPIYAIRPDATGDISLNEGEESNEFVVWGHPRGGSYLPTPLVHGDYLYVCRDNGVLSCYSAATGRRHYEQRLGGGRSGFTPSMVASSGRIYVTSEDGDVYVLQAGPSFRLLARNQMGEVCMATPAISEGRLYYRTRSHLVAIGE